MQYYQPNMNNNAQAGFALEVPQNTTKPKRSTFAKIMMVIGIILLIVVVGPPLAVAIFCGVVLLFSLAGEVFLSLSIVGYSSVGFFIFNNKGGKSSKLFYVLFTLFIGILFVLGMLHGVLGMTCSIQESGISSLSNLFVSLLG